MIMTVEQFRTYVTTDETDDVLSSKLAALELLIRKYTNNNFQIRKIRTTADTHTSGNTIDCYNIIPLKTGDTIQISDSKIMLDMLCTILSIENGIIVTNEALYDESNVLITKINYPVDVQIGVVNMMKWDLQNRDKVGIQSEAISRHSVTYFNMDGDNSMLGYPRSLCGFLKPYKKARF